MAQLQPMKLESRDISSISSANELFGSEKGLLVVRPGRGLAPWFCVPDGCYALVQRFGKDMDYAEGQPVWPPGYHWGPPWVQVSHLVTMQSVVFNMPVKDCKTQDNVTVTINLAICFRIKADPRKGEDPYLARNFVYKVTPRGLEQQLIDACEEATRKVARTLLHTEVYGLRTDKSGKKMKVLKGAGDADAPPSELEGDAALRSVAGPSDDERAALGRKYTDPEELFAALEAGGDDATFLLRGSWVRTQRGGRLPKRGDPLPPEARITVKELRAITKASECRFGALPVIALSHYWRTKEHPDPDGERFAVVPPVGPKPT